jgi:aryl-alcohol dehydrogenase-like predicted oxidoreductase
MKYRKLGKTNLDVSEICLGTWVFGGDLWGEVDDNVSENVVKEAIDKGVNFVDTAPIYGAGRSETVIGRAIKGKRDKVVLATKCGLKIKGHRIEVDLSSRFIREDIENSLRRLDVDAIDLYQCHWPDNRISFDETFGELNKLVKEGKVKHIGISNFDARQTVAACERAEVITNQVQYSLLDRRIEDELVPVLNKKNISILPYGVLGGGILTGKYRTPPEIKPGEVKDFFYKFYKEPEWSKAMKLVSLMDEIAEKHDASDSHVAINWMLSHKEVASCIVGCRTPQQLDENLKALDWELSKGDAAKLSDISLKIGG